jgi:hypothetical protein
MTRWSTRSDASAPGVPAMTTPVGHGHVSLAQPGGGDSAIDMIAACFRHQHPEAFGGEPVPVPALPLEVERCRHGPGEAPSGAT